MSRARPGDDPKAAASAAAANGDRSAERSGASKRSLPLDASALAKREELVDERGGVTLRSSKRPVERRRLFAGLAFLISVAALVGSLYPFTYRDTALEESLAGLLERVVWQPEGRFLADMTSNALLFLPIGFLLAGALWPEERGVRGMFWAVPALIVTLAATAVLASVKELTQLLFEDRYVSIPDMLANTGGAALGLVLWLLYGSWLTEWIDSRPRPVRASSRLATMLQLLAVAYVVYLLYPYDFTLRPSELADKYRQGNIILRPFATSYGSAQAALVALAPHVLVYAMIGAAAMLSWIEGDARRTVVEGLVIGLVAAIGAHFLKLLVLSTRSDVTDAFVAMGGVALGTATVAALGERRPRRMSRARRARQWAILGLLAWGGAMLGYLWYPYEFTMSVPEGRVGLEQLKQLPFRQVRATSEPLLAAFALSIPLGGLLRSLWPASASPIRSALSFGFLLAGTTVFAFVAEVGQVLLPGASVDLTDVIAAAGGAAVGMVIVSTGAWMRARRASPDESLAGLSVSASQMVPYDPAASAAAAAGSVSASQSASAVTGLPAAPPRLRPKGRTLLFDMVRNALAARRAEEKESSGDVRAREAARVKAVLEEQDASVSLDDTGSARPETGDSTASGSGGGRSTGVRLDETKDDTASGSQPLRLRRRLDETKDDTGSDDGLDRGRSRARPRDTLAETQDDTASARPPAAKKRKKKGKLDEAHEDTPTGGTRVRRLLLDETAFEAAQSLEDTGAATADLLDTGEPESDATVALEDTGAAEQAAASDDTGPAEATSPSTSLRTALEDTGAEDATASQPASLLEDTHAAEEAAASDDTGPAEATASPSTSLRTALEDTGAAEALEDTGPAASLEDTGADDDTADETIAEPLATTRDIMAGLNSQTDGLLRAVGEDLLEGEGDETLVLDEDDDD